MAKYLIALHALGLHAAYLGYLKEFFTEKGYKVQCPDLLGFGRTTKQNRGDIETFHDYTKEVAEISQEIRKHDPKADIFVWGESIGGTVALLYALEYPKCPRGVVAVNPVLSTNMGFSKIRKVQLDVMASLQPDKQIELPFLLQDMTDDEVVAKAIASDEMVCSSVTGRFWFALSKACVLLWTDATRIRVPFLIQYSVGSCFVSESVMEHILSVAPVDLKQKQALEGPFLLSLSRGREEVYQKAFSFFELCDSRRK
ncbi:MAG: lysophospholipase [Brevinematales bacterium]|nr:lysophospholipase [Brevinematales bacterium]